MVSKSPLIIGFLVLAVVVLGSIIMFPQSNTDEKISLQDTRTENESSPTEGNISSLHKSTRYVNAYEYMSPPVWIPEDEFSMESYEAGSYEVTRYPDTEPSQEHLDAAWRLYKQSFNAAEENGWFEFENAVEDGYSVEASPNHYGNVENISIYTGENNLNPQAPELLMYYQDPNNPDNKILTGYMYRKPLGSNERGEQIGGPLTVWHYHPTSGETRSMTTQYNIKNGISLREDIDNASELFEVLDLQYDNMSEFVRKRNRTAEMIHVWFVKHPEGPFGTSMSVPSENLREPVKMSESEFKDYAMNKYEERLGEGIVSNGTE